MHPFKPGDKLPNGAIFLDSIHLRDEEYLVLAVTAGYHPFVTWRLFSQDGEWITVHGDYFTNIRDAVKGFVRRSEPYATSSRNYS